MQTNSPSTSALKIAPSFVAFYGLLGVLQPFLPPLLLERGLSSQQAGYVLGLAALLSSVAPLFAAKWLGPRVSTRTMAWIFGAGVAIASLLLAFLAHANITAWGIGIILFALMWSPIAAIIDTLAVLATRTGKLTYGQLRMSGSFGFIIASSAIGWLFGVYKNISFDQYLIAACLFMLATTLLLPNLDVHPSETAEGPEKDLVAVVEKVPSYMYVLIAAMSLHWWSFGSYQYSYTMLAEHVGLQKTWIGLAWSLGVVSEVLCFLLADKLIKSFGWHFMMTFAFVAAGLRWVTIALFPIASVVVVSQILHGPGFAWFYTAAMAAIAQAGKGSLGVRLQLLFTGLVTGLGACLGNLWAGWACGHMAIHQLFFISAPIQIIALLMLHKIRAHRASTLVRTDP